MYSILLLLLVSCAFGCLDDWSQCVNLSFSDAHLEISDTTPYHLHNSYRFTQNATITLSSSIPFDIVLPFSSRCFLQSSSITYPYILHVPETSFSLHLTCPSMSSLTLILSSSQGLTTFGNSFLLFNSPSDSFSPGLPSTLPSQLFYSAPTASLLSFSSPLTPNQTNHLSTTPELLQVSSDGIIGFLFQPSFQPILTSSLSSTDCDYDCNDNGHCDAGRCVCDSGWTGSFVKKVSDSVLQKIENFLTTLKNGDLSFVCFVNATIHTFAGNSFEIVDVDSNSDHSFVKDIRYSSFSNKPLSYVSSFSSSSLPSIEITFSGYTLELSYETHCQPSHKPCGIHGRYNPDTHLCDCIPPFTGSSCTRLLTSTYTFFENRQILESFPLPTSSFHTIPIHPSMFSSSSRCQLFFHINYFDLGDTSWDSDCRNDRIRIVSNRNVDGNRYRFGETSFLCGDYFDHNPTTFYIKDASLNLPLFLEVRSSNTHASGGFSLIYETRCGEDVDYCKGNCKGHCALNSICACEIGEKSPECFDSSGYVDGFVTDAMPWFAYLFLLVWGFLFFGMCGMGCYRQCRSTRDTLNEAVSAARHMMGGPQQNNRGHGYGSSHQMNEFSVPQSGPSTFQSGHIRPPTTTYQSGHVMPPPATPSHFGLSLAVPQSIPQSTSHSMPAMYNVPPTPKDAKPGFSVAPPDDLICPISYNIMTDPVTAADGHTYERRAIQEWLVGHSHSPLTGQPLPHQHVVPNSSIQYKLDMYRQQKA
ncbi:hypothetical protein GEMRC1_007660 [Eukaryota sp. GEM-RC1]